MVNPLNTTCVYFIYEKYSESVKIGTSIDPFERLKQLQTGNPQELTLLGIILGGTEELEKALHKILWRYHISGEWFQSDVIHVFLYEIYPALIAYKHATIMETDFENMYDFVGQNAVD